MSGKRGQGIAHTAVPRADLHVPTEKIASDVGKWKQIYSTGINSMFFSDFLSHFPADRHVVGRIWNFMQSERLLTRYLESGSCADFERIVQAHGAMVFGTALRSTRSRALAEDVTQEVFVILARKATGIREPHKLGAWLHRTAIQCAANANRREAKRRKTMEKYSDDIRNLKFDSEEDQAAWHRALPHLDQAIEELPSTDREAVIMRFYERSSFRDIADLLNKSEGSCRKQVSRALDKLAGLLKKRGVAVPPTVLSIGLGGYLAHDILPIATGQITQLAMAAKSSVGVTTLSQTLLIMSGYKFTIVAASLAALIPVGLQWQANKAQAVSQSGPVTSIRVDDEVTRQTNPTEIAAARTEPRTSEQLLAEMQAISESGHSYRADPLLRHLMYGLREDEMEAALEALHLFADSPGKRSRLARLTAANPLFSRWSTFNPLEASRQAMDIADDRLRHVALNGLVQSWVTDDRESLEAFIEDLPPGGDRTKIDDAYWRYLAQSDPEAAADKALALDDIDQQTERLNRVLFGWYRDPGAGIKWLEKVPDSVSKDQWLDRLISYLAPKSPSEAFEKSLTLLEGTQQKSTMRRVMEDWADADPDKALAALIELPDTVRDGHIIEAVGRGVSDFNVINQFLEQLPGESDRSALINGLASGLPHARHEMRNVTPQNIEKIRQLVEGMPPGEDRFSARWNLAGAWAALDYEQARQWYHSQPEVSESMKEKFVRLNGR